MKFRKRPVVIDAIQFNGEWVDGVCHCSESDNIHIHTLEGLMRVRHGDWIIKGVNGEFYPCKPDIFDKTYEAIE